MINSQPPGTNARAVSDQAMAWIRRLASGTATAEDAEALRRWRSESPEHMRAFAEAKLLWETLGPAAETVKRQAGTSVLPAGVVHPSRAIARRALLGGALAAASVTLFHVGSKPPLRLWPTVDELRADLRTGKGEQRRVALTTDVSLILNTQTSIGLRPTSGGARGIELIEGEAVIAANIRDIARVDVVAADGRVTAEIARFNMRREGRAVSVTCFDGQVRVECLSDIATISSGQQVVYDARGLHEAVTIDPAVAAAWQNGQLIFRHQPLSRVIDEINRYGRSRIILMDHKLGQRDVVATFHIERIDEAVAHLAQAFGARARFLPGGIVLLG